jgi:hypothetical protein
MTMRLRKHHREVADHLRNEYDARHIRMEPGGLHPRMVFQYRDREYRLPLGGPSDHRSLKNIISDLRKKLSVDH